MVLFSFVGSAEATESRVHAISDHGRESDQDFLVLKLLQRFWQDVCLATSTLLKNNESLKILDTMTLNIKLGDENICEYLQGWI